MKRGQAFETMMLVISVIVALAILGVLTGILGGIRTPFGGDPSEKIFTELKKIASSGYGQSLPQQIQIPKGTKLDMRTVLKEQLPGIYPDTVGATQGNIRFCLSTGLGAGTTAVLANGQACTINNGAFGAAPGAANGGTTSFPVTTKDVSVFFVVCADAQKGDRGAYRIQFAGTEDKATTDCVID